MYEIIRTNISEVSFLNGIVKEVWFVTEEGPLPVKVIPNGKYSFTVIEDRLPEPRLPIIKSFFQKPYFKTEGTTISMLPEGMEVIKENTEKRKRHLERLLAEDAMEMMIISSNEKEDLRALTAIHTDILARTLVSLLQKDKQLNTAFNRLMIHQAMEKIGGFVDDMILKRTEPPTTLEN